MEMKRSLRWKFFTGISFLFVPILFLLFYVMFYAMDVVRMQAAQSNQNLLSLYVQQIDRSLEDLNHYLYKLLVEDTAIRTLGLFREDSVEYVLSRYYLVRKLDAAMENYKNADMFFVYTAKNDKLIANYRYYDQATAEGRSRILRQWIHESPAIRHWMLAKDEKGYGLVRWITENHVTVGAWIPVPQLMVPLQLIRLGDRGAAVIVSPEGEPLTPSFTEAFRPEDIQTALRRSGQTYDTIRSIGDGKTYLFIATKASLADIHMVVFLPEKDLLRHLPFLQRAVYAIPLATFFAVILFSVFLQRTFLSPLNQLVRGMNSVGRGDWTFRIKETASSEFLFLFQTFNRMAAEIRHLKIHVYEERLRLKEAEFKQLQSKISPHFYVNTLNIIYNLAAVRKYELVQKLARLMADHFNFTLRAGKPVVSLAEELNHVRNYLEIQLIRFTKNFSYEITVPERYYDLPVPMLTIQPFVENAIIHGMKLGSEPFRITIEAIPGADPPDETVRIIIRDNGKGFAPDILERLQCWHENGKPDCGHIGIGNVCHRLAMMFGDGMRCLFRNGENGGAIVELILPLQYGRERSRVQLAGR